MRFVRLLFCLILAAVHAAPAAAASVERVIFLGDSITEGYGLPKTAAYPELVAQELKAKGYHLQVINAGVSGSTSASAVGRLKWLLKGPQQPTLLMIALGGNDGLRGHDVKGMADHLTAAVRYAKERGISQILVAGMQMPPNYGPEYLKDFAAVFPALAKAEGVHLLPFLLAGVGGEAKLNQADGIHPNEAGQKVVAKTVTAALLPLIGPA